MRRQEFILLCMIKQEKMLLVTDFRLALNMGLAKEKKNKFKIEF